MDNDILQSIKEIDSYYEYKSKIFESKFAVP